MSASPARRRSGRRPGESGSREAIVRSARRLFAELGYDRATIRAIAADAGVDAALIIHFFGSKQELFVSVVELPFDPAAVLPELLSGDRSTVGERFARFFVSLLEDPDPRNSFIGLVRAAASEPEAARLLRERITERIFVPVADRLGLEDSRLRANLAGSQVVGLVMARYVVGVEPLASTDPETVVRALAPTFQRYLTEPLE